MLVTSIFPHNVFYPSKIKFQFLVTFILSPNASDLNQSEISSLSKELTVHRAKFLKENLD